MGGEEVDLTRSYDNTVLLLMTSLRPPFSGANPFPKTVMILFACRGATAFGCKRARCDVMMHTKWEGWMTWDEQKDKRKHRQVQQSRWYAKYVCADDTHECCRWDDSTGHRSHESDTRAGLQRHMSIGAAALLRRTRSFARVRVRVCVRGEDKPALWLNGGIGKVR